MDGFCEHKGARTENWNGSVYKLCYDCHEELEPTEEEIKSVQITIEVFKDV